MRVPLRREAAAVLAPETVFREIQVREIPDVPVTNTSTPEDPT